MAIDADVTEGCNPVIVNFTGDAGTWDFGDGSPAVTVAANPSRIYSQPGTYVVKRQGDADSVVIRVHDYPAAEFSIVGNPVGCASAANPFEVEFQDNSTVNSGNIVDWFWDFGDGNTSSDQNPTHAYTTSGSFSVTLRVTSGQGCENTVKKTDVVVTKGQLSVNFVPSVVNGCSVPHDVQFYNASIDDGDNPLFAWEFFEYDAGHPQGLGTQVVSLSTTDEDPIVTFDELKSYSVRFTVIDPSGCQTSVTRANVVRLSGYEVDFAWASAAPPDGDCSPYPIQFTGDFENVEFAWQDITWEFYNDQDSLIGSLFGEGNQSFIKSPLYSFEGPGVYEAKVTVDGIEAGCPTDSIQKTIILPDFLEPTIVKSETESCITPLDVNVSAITPNAARYEWDFNNDNVIDDTVAATVATFTGNSTHTIEVFVWDTMGCKSFDTTGIKIEPVEAQFLASRSFACAAPGQAVDLRLEDKTKTPETITYWKWQIYRNDTLIVTEEGTDGGTYKTINVALTATGSGEAAYDVWLTVSTDNCSDSIFKERVLVVGPKVEGDFRPREPYGCKGEIVEFLYDGEQGWDSLYWYRNSIASNLIDTLIRDGDGTYNISGTLGVGFYTPDLIVWSGGCADTVDYLNSDVTAPRYQVLLPSAHFDSFSDRCNPDSTLFLLDLSLGAQQISWAFGDSTDTLTARMTDFDPIPVFLPPEVRYPQHKYDGLGPWTVKQHVFHDNIINHFDSLTGAPLQSAFSQANSGIAKEYYLNDDGDSLLFARPFETADSISLVRCGVEWTELVTFNVNTIDLQIQHDQDTSQALCAPVTFTLSSNQTGMEEYYWRIGGGSIKEGETQNVTISTPGFYTVELTVVTTTGCLYKKVFPDFLKVYGNVVNFEYCPPQPCVTEDMRFVNKTKGSENFDKLTWAMGNGVRFSNDPTDTSAEQRTLAQLNDFDYSYPDSLMPDGHIQAEGLDVTLYITDQGGCQDSSTVKVRPTEPDPYFLLNPTLTCNTHHIDVVIPSDTIPYLGFAPFVYNWLVVDEVGDTVARKDGVTFTFTRIELPLPTDTGITRYQVILTMEDFKRSTQGAACVDTVSQFYEFGQIFPTANFSIVAEEDVCPPRKVEFADSSVAAVHNGSPIPIVSWDWNFGDSSFSTVQNPAKIYTEPNLQGYDVSLTVTDASGCSNTFTLEKSVTINGIAGTLFGQKTTPFADSVVSTGIIMDFVEGDFSAAPFNVRFTVGLDDPADSVGVNRYILDFGDGQLGFGDTINHVYTTPGVYTPVLIIESADSCRYTTDADFSVIANGCDLPEMISDNSVVCNNETITLNATPPPTAIAPITVTWTDLSTNLEIAQTDTVTVTMVDSRSFLYSMEDSVGCVSSLIYDVEVVNRPTLGFHADTALCQGDSLGVHAMVLDFDSVLSYNWTTNPDIGSSTDSTLSISNIVSSTMVRLSVIDTSAGCETTSQFSVTVNPAPVVEAGISGEACPREEVQLTASYVTGGTGQVADYTYSWSGDGISSPVNSNTVMIDAISANGEAEDTLTHYVTLTDTLGCVGFDTVQTFIRRGIEFDDFVNQQICLESGVEITGEVSGGTGDSSLYSYSWSPSLGLDNASIKNPTSSASATTRYTLTVIDEAFCEDTMSVNVVLQPFVFLDLADSAIACEGEELTLNLVATGGTGDFAYNWSPGLAFDDSLSSQPRLNRVSDTLRYNVTVTDEIGCYRMDSLVVSPIKLYADAGDDQMICFGMQTQLNGLGSGQFVPLTYEWTMVGTTAKGTLADKDGLADSDVQSGVFNPLFLGNNRDGEYTYSLEIEDSMGCRVTATNTVVVDVNQPQQLEPLDSVLHCFTLAPELTLEGRTPFLNYEWFDTGDTTQTSIVFDEGLYTVGFEDSSQCYYIDTILVGTLCPPELHIPDAFSPNDDGLNDELELFGKWITEVEVIFFNRWGEVIAELNGMSQTWDGTYRGQLVQLGTYPWQATYKGRYSDEVYSSKGHVTVVK